MFKKIIVFSAMLLVLGACSGGGGGGSASTAASASTTSANSSTSSTSTTTTSSTTTTTPTLNNFAQITVDAGPPALQAGANGFIEANFAYMSVMICAPGTTNCQTIDHVQVDTGSIGLRLVASVINSSVLSALPAETDTSSNPVGECYGYIDGYVFGSVRQADTQMGGESVANMPIQVIGDTGAAYTTAPTSCSKGGGTNLDSVMSLGANGIIGIGTTPTDCGTTCTVAGRSAAAIYYDCPASGCSSIIARSSSTVAPFQQLPNPVAALSVDNNGSLLSLPAVPLTGESSLTGTLFFGIGTQTNNALGTATVLTTTTSTSTQGSGLVTATYNSQSLPDSFIDSGSSIYFFVDSNIPQCTGSSYAGYYCPPSTLQLTPTIAGQNGNSASAAFPLYNAKTLLTTSFSVLPGIGGNPSTLGVTNAFPTSFDFGLPFFYGKKVFTAIEGRTAGGSAGPYYAY